MRFSVICAEDVPIYEQSSSQDGYMGNFVSESFAEICTIWPQGEIHTDFTEPVRSDVPVLLISGEADPVTPPVNGDFTAQTLSNSLHDCSGMGHVNIYRAHAKVPPICKSRTPGIRYQLHPTNSTHAISSSFNRSAMIE
jgi:hypothetical protein